MVKNDFDELDAMKIVNCQVGRIFMQVFIVEVWLVCKEYPYFIPLACVQKYTGWVSWDFVLTPCY